MSFNQYIDHTILKAETKKEDVLRIIKEAKENHFCSVCINPTWVSLAAKELADSDVKVCTVIGFPLGANTTAVKAFETTDAINNGADEVDMVINIGALRDGNEELVLNDIQAVVDAAKDKATNLWRKYQTESNRLDMMDFNSEDFKTLDAQCDNIKLAYDEAHRQGEELYGIYRQEQLKCGQVHYFEMQFLELLIRKISKLVDVILKNGEHLEKDI